MFSATRHLRLGALLLGYLLLAVWFTWPLAASLGTRLPCTNAACGFDTLYSAWVAAWLSHALTTGPTQLANANIYFPASSALYYGPAGLGTVPYFLPTFLATGNAAIALNVMILVSAALTALALHWVVWRWTGSHAAGFLAAWSLFVNRWYLWGVAASAPHLMVLQYFPLVVYAAAKPLATRRERGLLLGLSVVQSLTDLVYVAPALVAVLAMLGAIRIARPAGRRSGLGTFLVLAALPLCLAPFLWGYVWVRVHNPLLATQTVWKLPLGLTIPSFYPTDLRSLFWRLKEPTSLPPAALVTIAVGALVAAFWRSPADEPTRRRAWGHAALWALGGTLISIAPVARWGPGGPSVPVPHALLAEATPLYEVIRVPGRLGMAGMMGLCLLFGIAFGEIARCLGPQERRWGSRGAATAALAAALAALVYRFPPAGVAPLPPSYRTQPAPFTDPALLHQLRAKEGPLLELPALRGRDSPVPRGHAVAMYRSTLHWRPLLNGYASFWPAGFLERMRLTQELPKAHALSRLVCETGVRSILVNLVASPPAQRRLWSIARKGPLRGLELIGAYRGQLLFDVTLPLPGDPGGPRCPPPARSDR